MKALFRIIPLIIVVSMLLPAPAFSCSCIWVGGFMKVAPQSPLILRGVVKSYEGESHGIKLAMNVDVLEVFKGNVAAKTLRIQGDNGMLCRAAVKQFKIGSEYIFALNGPGAKPGYDGGPAISACGQYWLELKGAKAFGSIEENAQMSEVQELSLDEFRVKLMKSIAGNKERISFYGEIKAGESYERHFRNNLIFRLEAITHGWIIRIFENGREEDLSRLSPPLHFSPNPREIEGWHFRNSDNTGPNEAGEKNVNAPGLQREFIFSPEVGKSIDGPQAKGNVTSENVEDIAKYGRGTFIILEYRLSDLEPGKQAKFEWLKFKVEFEVQVS